MSKPVCLSCRSSTNVCWLDNGDNGCTVCKIRFNSASIKMYNRIARVGRLGHYKNRSTGEWTPTADEIAAMKIGCWQTWDGVTGIEQTVVPF